jgi:hypothetical protein
MKSQSKGSHLRIDCLRVWAGRGAFPAVLLACYDQRFRERSQFAKATPEGNSMPSDEHHEDSINKDFVNTLLKLSNPYSFRPTVEQHPELLKAFEGFGSDI